MMMTTTMALILSQRPSIQQSSSPHTTSKKSSLEYRYQNRPGRGRERRKFPFVLYEILSDPRNFHIIHWMSHGRSWRVHDREKLAKVLCPRYFNHCKFESFTRSATGWGFKRVAEDGPDYNCYYHRNFFRGRPELIPLILRLESSGNKSKSNGDGDETEGADFNGEDEVEQGDFDNPHRGQFSSTIKSEANEDDSNSGPRQRPQQHRTSLPQLRSDPGGDHFFVDFDQSHVDHNDVDEHINAPSPIPPSSGYNKLNYQPYQDDYHYEQRPPPQFPPSHTLEVYRPPVAYGPTKNSNAYYDHSYNRHQFHEHSYQLKNLPSPTTGYHQPRQFENPQRKDFFPSQTQPHHQHEQNYFNSYIHQHQRYEYHQQHRGPYNYYPPHYQQTFQQNEYHPSIFSSDRHDQIRTHRNDDRSVSSRLETEIRPIGNSSRHRHAYPQSYSEARAYPPTRRLNKESTTDRFTPPASSSGPEISIGNGTSSWTRNYESQQLDDERKPPAQPLEIEHGASSENPTQLEQSTMADLGNATARERKETVMPGSMMEMATSLDQLKCGDQSLEEREYLLAFKPPAAIIRKRPHHKDTVLSANISDKSLLKESWSNEEQEDNMKTEKEEK
mmetsp:Transcript_29770/g.61865  ORF Transcript_29770/g.61865 Transcript_29770/m.61865 type:complete len:613 (-) Transcript_29770:54-1892(-)